MGLSDPHPELASSSGVDSHRAVDSYNDSADHPGWSVVRGVRLTPISVLGDTLRVNDYLVAEVTLLKAVADEYRG